MDATTLAIIVGVGFVSLVVGYIIGSLESRTDKEERIQKRLKLIEEVRAMDDVTLAHLALSREFAELSKLAEDEIYMRNARYRAQVDID